MSRVDLLVTTALKPMAGLDDQARALAAELDATYVPRQNRSLPAFLAEHPEADRALVVQTARLVLVDRDGWEFFFHPNMAYVRLATILRGGYDPLVEATDLRPGDTVLDGTLGFGAEAIVCAHVVGADGAVDGVEAVPEMGVVVRDGLGRFKTAKAIVNAAMRRVRVVHLGAHLDYLRACPDDRYDVVTLDPFFDTPLGAEEALSNLRAFGDHRPLDPLAVVEAQRVARRRVVVKSARWSPLLDTLGIDERVGGRTAKVVYGVIRCDRN